ncbi:MAG: hypothetical protein K2X03_28485 [Bryobacteraceae bacterium]|nr:hypothetical protein [Bryobacteraceae bacterium]
MKRLWTMTLLGAAAAWAQRDVVTIQPRLTGGDSSSGRCIVRIMVDDTVNVRIGNGQIRVETVTGRPSRDDGTECSSLLRNGRNLSDFRFSGRDGRGEVRLQSDPRQDRRGEAVIFIRDAKGGDEGYTFEVSWQGDDGSSTGNRGGGGFFGGRPQARDTNQGANACLDRVRAQAESDFGVSNLIFENLNADNNNGPRDRITGTARAGRRGDLYRYECQMNLNNGNVRNVSVRRQ